MGHTFSLATTYSVGTKSVIGNIFTKWAWIYANKYLFTKFLSTSRQWTGFGLCTMIVQPLEPWPSRAMAQSCPHGLV